MESKKKNPQNSTDGKNRLMVAWKRQGVEEWVDKKDEGGQEIQICYM